MNFIKYKTLINKNYRLLPQTGDFHIMMDNKKYFLRISYLPSPQFESIVIRILNNHEIHHIDDLTYQDTLKQILRHDPDIIMIGEIRDSQTAKIAITCALTGHLVLTTIHASNSLLSLKRLMNLGVSEVDIQDVVIGSMSQRIKYDALNKRVLVLSEIMQKKDINHYFRNGDIDYMDFHSQALKLIDIGFDAHLFKGEMDNE